ncbi:MAG: hypothetical protein WC763_01030 [Candidatus Paceibacterota bacterium]|jgi:hypothetical protein
MTFEQKILDQIKTKHLKPLSKGYFKTRDLALWGLLVVFVAALGVGVGMIIYGIRSTNLSVLAKLELTLSQKALFFFPVFWILACAVIATVAFINLRKTRRGYRVTARQFIIIAALVAVGVGSIVYALNVTQYLSRVAANRIPLYKDVVAPNTSTWLDPNHGLLSGVIRSRDSDTSFYVRDSEAVLWHVTGDDMIIPTGYIMQTGERIKIIGKRTGDDAFTAREIHPWSSN